MFTFVNDIHVDVNGIRTAPDVRMLRAVRRPLVLALLLAPGCFLSHTVGAPADAGPPRVDASFADAGPLAVGCAALGGTCELGRWANCPPGRQPSADIHSDCVPVVSRGDFCCVAAPPSTASLSTDMIDCFPTRACEWCWTPIDDPSITCAGGRVACQYTCLD